MTVDMDVTAPDSLLPPEAGVSTGLLASGWAYDDVAMVLEITPSEVGSTSPYPSRSGGLPLGNVRQECMGLARAAGRRHRPASPGDARPAQGGSGPGD
ncbi:hypothetical protein ACIO53_34145 [Streptomyces sp. NPDC087305]|uniref:hypothetical protein n=1 Tax=Streptomyces sp. NPDC087305 TaxID=3365781 RepID=UPI0038274EDC